MNNLNRYAAASAPVIAAAVLGACSFTDRPALPRRSRIDTVNARIPADELRQIVDQADIFYLPADRLDSDEQNGAVSRLLAVLQQSTPRLGVCLGNVNADLQPLLQEWNGGRISLDDLVDRVRFTSTSEREAVRRLLRDTRERSLASVPVSCTTGLSCTAENVAREFRQLEGGKLFVVIDRRDLDPASGVPFLVSRRLQVRQVVLDVRARGHGRDPLLTGASGTAEIVDRAPGSGGDRR